ncbi:MAG: MBOAT family protein [Erysipelotrichaceae bacterium]|nr:MBOAT family protein [Erysipelotrichaceae bacterium]
MLFNSFSFAIFLPIVFAAYWLIKDRYRWIVIVLSSYFFYACSGPKYLLLIFFVTIVSYISARLIEKHSNKKKIMLLAVVLICLGVLFFFKYFNFFIETTNTIFGALGIQADFATLNIVLPVGISFYTFQSIGYVIDVYRGTTKTEHHLGVFMAFVSFFPQLVAGPIERSSNLLPQIKNPKVFDYEQAIQGARLMIWGYFKKLVIADVLSSYVQTVYDSPSQYSGFSLVIAAVFFSIQIYCDFSGYSDIAIGVAKLFGIDLMTNFKSPYFSRSVKEFWGRWHISLSTWFKDYVYIPLGGNRVGKVRHIFNLLVTFLVSGLWHGANWTFVIWGGVHGVAQVIENTFLKKINKIKSKLLTIVRVVIVFVFAVFAWNFFVSNTFSDAIYVIKNAFVGISSPLSYIKEGFASIGISKISLATILFSLLVLVLYDFFAVYKGYSLKKHKILRWVFYVFVALLVVFLSVKGVQAEFIYFQF